MSSIYGSSLKGKFTVFHVDIELELIVKVACWNNKFLCVVCLAEQWPPTFWTALVLEGNFPFMQSVYLKSFIPGKSTSKEMNRDRNTLGSTTKAKVQDCVYNYYEWRNYTSHKPLQMIPPLKFKFCHHENNIISMTHVS